jgi:hypothetical protein
MSKRKRRASGDRHIRLHHWMLRSAAWRALSPVEKAVLLDIWQRHNGLNNGQIVYSVREAEKIGVTKSPAARALERLIELGFLRITKDAIFRPGAKEARCWKLTMEPVNEHPATKEFMRWQPESARPKHPHKRRPNGLENLFPSPPSGTNKSPRGDLKKRYPENAGDHNGLLGGAGGGQSGIGGTPKDTANHQRKTAKNDDFLVPPAGVNEEPFSPPSGTLIHIHGGSGAKAQPEAATEPAKAVPLRPWRSVRFGDEAKAERIRRPSS